MHRIERLEIIQEYVTRNGKAEVSQLASIAGVSEATVRRDLTFLAGQKKIVRSHGGAVLNENLLMDESPFEYRVSYNRDRKLVIARAALQFVQPRSTCFFDCSSTVNELAKLITDQKFVAVTDTMWTAIELNKNKCIYAAILYCRCLALTALTKQSSGRLQDLPGRSSVIYEPHAGYLARM